MTGRFILTAAEMRAAEAAAIAAGTPVETLMERAGTAAAEAIWRYAGPLPTLVLCGPGNNGGDGYVIARQLAARGMDVSVAALGEPNNAAAQAARRSWLGPVASLERAEPTPLLVDALFGTGLTRPLDDAVSGRLTTLAARASVRVAIDLPSGVAADDGAILSPVPDFDLTIAFQTLKPSHRLQPAARHMGRVVIAEIGIIVESRLSEIAAARPCGPGPDDHKYTRGYVAVLAGTMPGASALTTAAALRAGAGYVRLLGAMLTGLPHAVVQSAEDVAGLLADERIGAVAIGPGLGRNAKGERLLDLAIGSRRHLILDADALILLGERSLPAGTILTPHDGEFVRLFPGLPGSKIDRARAAARTSGAIIVYKGADTVVAAPDGRAAIAPPASPWLATAGTGDVLTGIVAARYAALGDPFHAACEAVWLHGRAAERAGPGLIADDLIGHL